MLYEILVFVSIFCFTVSVGGFIVMGITYYQDKDINIDYWKWFWLGKKEIGVATSSTISPTTIAK